MFALQDERLVAAQLAFPYKRKRIILVENEITRGLPGTYVDTFAFPDRRFEVRWKDVSIPYSIFDKDQRVTHTAITENKHLIAVLEHIKTEQDKAASKNIGPASKRRAISQPANATMAGIQSWQNGLKKRMGKPHHTPLNDHARMAVQGSDIRRLRPTQPYSRHTKWGISSLLGGGHFNLVATQC